MRGAGGATLPRGCRVPQIFKSPLVDTPTRPTPSPPQQHVRWHGGMGGLEKRPAGRQCGGRGPRPPTPTAPALCTRLSASRAAVASGGASVKNARPAAEVVVRGGGGLRGALSPASLRSLTLRGAGRREVFCGVGRGGGGSTPPPTLASYLTSAAFIGGACHAAAAPGRSAQGRGRRLPPVRCGCRPHEVLAVPL